jgi:hypothetical protein
VASRSLLQVLHHGSSTASLDARRGSSPSTQIPSGRASSSPNRRHQGATSHVRFLLSNHVLHIDILICIGTILLDNPLQCLLFIAVIDLSRIYDSTAILICNAVAIFMIYTWIKIKIKVLIFPTNISINTS